MRSRRRARPFAAVLVGAAVLSAGVVAPVSGAAAGAGGLRRTGNVLPPWLLSNRVGAPDPNRRVTVDVALADPNEGLERALAAAVVDPGSPQYHRFPTPDQYAARFGLPDTQRRAVMHWLRGTGLEVRQQSALGDLFAATGTVAQLEDLFDVRISVYRSGPTQFLANDVAPAVPARIPVAAVIGLNDLQRFAPIARAEHVERAGVHPAVGPFLGRIDVKSLWRTYDAPSENEGQGARAGVFMAGNTDAVVGSLRVFEDTEGLPKVPVRVVRTEPGKPEEFMSNDGAEEWMLDTDASTGMAPRMSELSLYTAKSLQDADVVSEMAYWANDPTGPELMNASFGTCEAFPIFSQTGRGSLAVAVGNNIQTPVEKSLMQAFTEGRTLFVASGDTGSSCPVVSLPVVGPGNGVLNQVVPAQDYPAASAWVTAVGGTVLALAKDGARKDEQAWAFGGGGSSLFIPEPAWQRTESNVNRACLVTDADGAPLPPGTVCRGVPDIAALSGNGLESLWVTNYNQPGEAGGTSLSSPLAMGMWARVAAATRKHLGPASPAIYGLTPAQRAQDFQDITGGEIAGNGLYLTGPGWDYTTGYGAPDIAHLAADLAGGTAPANRARAARVPDPRTGDAVACLPFGTSPPGNLDTSTLGDKHDGQDITSAAMALSDDGKSLVITVRGPHLSPKLPLGAMSATVQVAWLRDGVTYVAQSSADLAGKVTGTLTTPRRQADPDGSTPPAKPAAEINFPAAYGSGELTMTIPLSDIGSPKVGDRLRYPVALSGVDGNSSDVAGPTYDYTVGQRCR